MTAKLNPAAASAVKPDDQGVQAGDSDWNRKCQAISDVVANGTLGLSYRLGLSNT
jgi:hypothetical protein